MENEMGMTMTYHNSQLFLEAIFVFVRLSPRALLLLPEDEGGK